MTDLAVMDDVPVIPLSAAAIELRADGYEALAGEDVRHIMRVALKHIVAYRMELERQEMSHMPEVNADE